MTYQVTVRREEIRKRTFFITAETLTAAEAEASALELARDSDFGKNTVRWVGRFIDDVVKLSDGTEQTGE